MPCAPRFREISDGRYTFEDALDDDGFSDRPLKIVVALTVSSGTVAIDFTGSDPQAAGSVNANFADHVVRVSLRAAVPDS